MRASSLSLLLGVLVGAFPAAAAPPPKLVEARKLIDDLEMEAALKALDAADKTEGNDRASVLEIWTLQGVAFGTLGKDAKTRDSFRKLLMLNPAATLPPDQPPRVRTPFLEAREWVASNGPLSASVEAELGGGRVKSLVLKVEKDVLRLVRTARFHLKTEDGEDVQDVPVTSGRAEVPVGKPAVSWWAELISDRKATLVELGTASAPRESHVPGAEPVASRTEPVGSVEQSAPVPGGWRRPVGITLLSAGVVAAGVGVIFGVQSGAARARLTGAEQDAQGRVVGLTQLDAASLEAQANSQAVLANLLFGVGGALATAGVVFVIIGPDHQPTLTLAPTAGGAVLSGSF